MAEERLTVHIASDLAELARLATKVDEFCMARAVPAGATFQLNVALEELLTQTICSGFDDGRAHQITVVLACDGRELVAEISDDARPFDPRHAPPAAIDAASEKRLLGGIGTVPVTALVDAMAYARRDGRNHVTLRKRIAGGS